MALLQARSDIEVLTFPNGVGKADFNALLREHAPVHAVALGPTRFGEDALVSAGDIRVVTRIGVGFDAVDIPALNRSAEHTSELQSLMRISYAVFCLKTKT